MKSGLLKYCFTIALSFLVTTIASAQSPCGGGDDRGGFGCPILEFFGLIPPKPGTPINIPRVHAVDPNEISGPLGLDSSRWVAKKDRLGYTIFFENDPDFATAPAQVVKINLPVDPKLNINSVRLGNYAFGRYSFDVPPNSTFYSQRLDLRDSLGIYVDVTAGIDVVKREVFWIFESIDPITGFAPEDADKGFLPVNDTTVNIYNDTLPKKGEGFVTFTIVPASSAITGDTVKAKASIIFDINAPLETNTWTNLIDAFPPESALDSLPDLVALGDSLLITWTAEDDSGGVGLDYYDVYASKDGGPFLLIAEKIDTTFYKFIGTPGATYDFYTRATDRVGNTENPKFAGEQRVLFAASVQLIASIVSKVDSICAGTDAVFKVKGTSGATLRYTLSHRSDTLSLLLTGSNQDIIVDSATSNITLTLLSLNLNNSQAALDSSTVITVFANPLVNLLPNNDPICAGSDAVFTVNGTAGAILTYTLSGQTGNQTLVLSGTNQSIVVDSALEDQVLKLVAIERAGEPVCSNLLLNQMDTIQVQAKPSASIVSASGPNCAGTTAVFTVSGTAGATLNYTLTGQVGTQSLLLNGANQNITLDTATGDIYLELLSVVASESLSCTTTLTAKDTVQVIGLPTAEIVSNNGPILSGTTATFTVSGTAGAVLTYTLTGQNGNQTLLLNGGNQEISVPGASDAITLSLNNVATTGSPACSTNLDTSTVINITAFPTAEILSNNSPVCASDTAVFTIKGTTGTLLTYQLTGLSGNQTLLLTGINQKLSVFGVNSPSVLTLLSVEIPGFPNSTVALNIADTVEIVANPAAVIVADNGPVCSGTDAVFTIQGTTGATLSYTISGQNGTQTLLLTGNNQTITAPAAISDVYLTLLQVASGGSPVCTTILTAKDTIRTRPNPTAQLVTNNGPIAAGSTAIFTVQGSAGAVLTYTLTGQSGNQTLALTGSSQSIEIPAASTDLTLQLISVAYANAPMCTVALNASATIEVIPLPTAQILSSNDPICTGDTAVFTVKGSAGATLTYSLSDQAGSQTLALTGVNQTILVYGVTTPSILTLQSVEIPGLANSTVTLSAKDTVGVIALPVASIVAVDGPICIGTTAHFTVQGTSGATLTYQLSNLLPAQTLLLTGSNQLIEVNNVTADLVLTLQKVSITGCETLLTAKDTIQILPAATAQIVVNNGPICAGGDAVFTVKGTVGATLSYSLTGLIGAQTLLLNGSDQTITAASATAPVELTLLSINSNTASVCTTALNVKDTVQLIEAPTALILSNNGPILDGATAIFTIQGTAGATLEYGLTGQAGALNVLLNGTPQNISVPNVTSNVTLSLFSVNLPDRPNCNVALSVSSTVVLTASPTAAILANNGPVCADSTAIFTVKGTAGATLTYNLNGTGPQTLALTGLNQILQVTGATDDVVLELISVEIPTIANSAVALSKKDTVQVIPAPLASIVSNNGPIAEGADASFIVIGTPGAILTYALTGVSGNQTLVLTGANQTLTASNAQQSITLSLLTVENAGSPNCVQALTAASTVTVIPVFNLVAAIVAADTVCSGEQGTFKIKGTNGATLTYQLNGGASQTLLLDGSIQSIVLPNLLANATLTLIKVEVLNTPNSSQNLDTTAVIVVNSRPTVSLAGVDFLCQDSTIVFSGTATGTAISGVTLHQWAQSGVGEVLINNLGNGTATFKGLSLGKVFITYNVLDTNGCSALSPALDSLIVLDCGAGTFPLVNDSPAENNNKDEYMIGDPCTCAGNGLFDETVWIEPSLPNEIWTVKSITSSRIGGAAPLLISAGSPLTYRQINPGLGIHEIAFQHVDSSGFSIVVEGPNAPGTMGNVLRSISNICYYPDISISNIPALISADASAFVVTGTAANQAAGMGTFTLNGVVQTGAGPSPTQLSINPSSLLAGLNTLTYTFDAGAAGSNQLNDPGCAVSLTTTFRVASGPCACQDIRVTLDQNCQFRLSAALIAKGNCFNATVRVMDDNPNNGDLIDCPGVWTYGLFDANNNIICWGKVTAEDKTPPAIICTNWLKDTLDCYDVSYVLNNPKTIGNVGETASPRPAANNLQAILNAEGVGGTGACGLLPPALVADNVNNLGYAYFEDNCRDCACRTAIRWSDRVVFYGCDEMKTNGGIYARIFRTWTATDCNGLLKDTVQEILFSRPSLQLASGNDPSGLRFRGAGSPGTLAKVPASGYDWVVEYPSCTADKNLIKKEDVTPSFCSYFNRLVDPKNNRCLFIDQVECNYAVQIKDTEFPICNGKGLKIDRELYIFDWCSGGIVDTLHVLIKIGDFAGPELIKPAQLAEISTGPMDCTAAFPINVTGLKNMFGVEIRDCNLSNISVSLKTKDRYVKGILVAENVWEEVKYPVMNGQMFGVPLGRHRMIIFAVDACYGASKDSFEFEVKDKIAPVLKCDDDLTVTLSNANGYSNGYAKLNADELDEGSWDNCKLSWLAVRRQIPDNCIAAFIANGYDTNGNGKLDPLPANGDLSQSDGFDRNGDGDIADFGETFLLKDKQLLSPLMDFAEFFCCDLFEKVTVELWAEDTNGNRSFCWSNILVEDKVSPTCIAPWGLTLDCDDPRLADMEDKVRSAVAFGDVTITSGNDCAALDTNYTLEKHLKCGAGYIIRKWTLTKQTAKGPLSVSCSQKILLRPIHQYNICFPKDANSDCKVPIIDTALMDELSCDILALNVSNKRYDASDGECYKIFRTYTVINWCAYDDRCGDPLSTSGAYVIDRSIFENYGKAPIYVLVRDEDRDLDEEFYLSKDLQPNDKQDYHLTGDLSPKQPYASTRLGNMPYCPNAFAENTFGLPQGEYHHSFMYTQIIKVYDNEGPVVRGVRDTFCTDPTACTANITKVVTIEDNCTEAVELENQSLMIAPFQTTELNKMILYSTPKWSVKNLGAGKFEIKVNSLPEGLHDLVVVGRDDCGNLSTPTRIPFVVKDCKAPAPICINGLAVDLMPNGPGDGMMTIWATDFIASKIFDCNGQGPETKDGLKLISKYSVNRVGEAPNPSSTSIAVNCADKNKIILVELHAWDELGNHDFCVTFIEVQDNRKVCSDTINPNLGEIAGVITTDDSEPIPGVKVDISGAAQMSQNTGVNGGFNFSRLLKANDYTLTAQLDKNHLNGVSTFDLILLQKHILGVLPITNPYRLIAGDANNSKSISTLDIIQIRKLILGLDERFKSVPSWRFVDAAYQFTNPSNPWLETFPEVINVNDLDGAAIANFIGIKIGDVNGNASPNGFIAAEVRNDKKMLLNLEELDMRKGESYTVAITSKDLAKFQGYQFTLGVDPAQAQIEGIEYTGVMKPENVGLFLRNGLISGSYHASNGRSTGVNASAQDVVLFSLKLKANSNTSLSKALSINSLLTRVEAYSLDDEVLDIAINFIGNSINEQPVLHQNVPNPFAEETSIGFYLPKAAHATLQIRDSKGALVHQVENIFAKGNSKLTIQHKNLGASGVFYYTLKTDVFMDTKKMVLLAR